jgi:hypothetical protein
MFFCHLKNIQHYTLQVLSSLLKHALRLAFPLSGKKAQPVLDATVLMLASMSVELR